MNQQQQQRMARRRRSVRRRWTRPEGQSSVSSLRGLKYLTPLHFLTSSHSIADSAISLSLGLDLSKDRDERSVPPSRTPSLSFSSLTFPFPLLDTNVSLLGTAHCSAVFPRPWFSPPRASSFSDCLERTRCMLKLTRFAFCLPSQNHHHLRVIRFQRSPHLAAPETSCPDQTSSGPSSPVRLPHPALRFYSKTTQLLRPDTYER